ncbi:MAG: domain containing protein [Thermoleophilia bacterium]|nr:domain containing protein [Thermoleophilia bacterium]
MEQFVPRVTYASFGRRAWGLVLDLVVDLLVLGALGAVTEGSGTGGLFALWYLIHHVGLVTEGGSLGMRLAGLRVVASDGTRLRLWAAVVRELVRVCASLPPLGLGFLWMLDDRERRTWHDLAAQSVVVREGDPSIVVAPDWAGAPPWQQRRAADDAAAPGT